MEPPECPVCLQPYEFAGDSVPRVLPCGHSTCESCLCALPRRPAAPSTVRCPACNILVRIPDLGPSALPKNIDLLRFCSPDYRSLDRETSPNPNSKPNPYPILLPLPWTEDLYAKWKDLVLPHDSISLVTFESGLGTATASLYCSSSSHRNRKAILLPLDTLSSFSAKRGRLRPSYLARVMNSLQQMGEDGMNQLRLLMNASSSCRRGISSVFGLWMDPEEEISRLFIVCERFEKGVLDVLTEKMNINDVVAFSMMAMEMCEAVMALHSECFVCGCLLPDCFVFDEHGHCILDLSRVLVSGKRIRLMMSGCTSVSDSAVFASPEVVISLQGSLSSSDCGFDDFVGYGSDVWSLACAIAMILLGDAMLGNELFQRFCDNFARDPSGHFKEILFDHYEVWKENLVSKLEALLLETKLESLLQVLTSSLSYQPQNRPQVKELWSCIRSLLTKTQVASLAATDSSEVKENFVSCLIIGDMCLVLPETNNLSTKLATGGALVEHFNIGQVCTGRHMVKCMKQDEVDAEHSERLDVNDFNSISIEAHHDCITALAIGGGYLFSASFDKTIKMWFLQDFSLVQTLKGHEHKIMAMVVIDGAQPLCISGDSSSGIFVWRISNSSSQELLKSWYEHDDWRYSGIHSLVASGTSHLYSGGGDKSVKAWSLQDYSLSCVMTGHKSTVSSLAVSDGVLYSGSWDGTIRLWSLYDHSLLSELSDNTTGGSYPLLSLSVNHHLVISSYEDGCVKVWRNDMFVKSIKIQKGAIFALHVDSKWMCTGGWDMTVSIQELIEDELQVDVRPVASLIFDSVITSLLHWHGKLFVGFSNKIKVFHTSS
ncbi:uncharacterized protein LOC110105013 isoform X1 [Dendrobium catenatum]|uniref:Zinc finger CCCH domain-containing protein 62 n=1 Tax=Dendrobium catenatum TaxID=906689 RepID=A0A2I0W7K5_9ASPA|nr:uncharacterized protein LOC110105013 isoform X1 [Dendrobium catenatum]PKU71632.1 Zinc finger CCCH domain-containing protein 62 [Dendrobium catenatum]